MMPDEYRIESEYQDCFNKNLITMEKGKYADLTTRQLQKRKKTAFILLVILIVAVVLDVSILIINLISGKGFMNALFVTAAACFVIFIPIYTGIKKIEGELKNREKN